MTLPKFAQKLVWRHEERILLEYSANDNHRMRPHDVNHRVSPKLSETVCANDYVIMAPPDFVHPRPELNYIIDL